jgi:hypothetical protein
VCACHAGPHSLPCMAWHGMVWRDVAWAGAAGAMARVSAPNCSRCRFPPPCWLHSPFFLPAGRASAGFAVQLVVFVSDQLQATATSTVGPDRTTPLSVVVRLPSLSGGGALDFLQSSTGSLIGDAVAQGRSSDALNNMRIMSQVLVFPGAVCFWRLWWTDPSPTPKQAHPSSFSPPSP